MFFWLPSGALASTLIQPNVEAGSRSPVSQFGAFLIPSDLPSVIVLNGEIGPATPLDFRRALKAAPDAAIVVLNSVGGDVDSGLLIAQDIHSRGLATYVPPKMACYSACSYLFFAGAQREVDGVLGVHQLAMTSPDLVYAQSTISDVLDTLHEFGVSQEVVSIMLRTPPDQVHIFTPQEITEFGIDHGEPIVAAASIPQQSSERPAAASADISTGPALLLEASQDGTHGAVPFSGTVAWSGGTDESGRPTLVGKASIPARNLDVTVLIRKSSDPRPPASQVIEINFSLTGSFTGGAIAILPGILLKNDERVQGTPLIGATTRVVSNSFLFSLSSSSNEETANEVLLTSRKWMDLAMVYASGAKAIITLQMPPGGDAIEALRSTPEPDPFEYCSKVGTIDAPGSDWTGPRLPALIKEAVSPSQTSDRQIHWRCAGGEVLACNADRAAACDMTPTVDAMIGYCARHPDAKDISAPNGSWSCNGKHPVIPPEQTWPVDARGFYPGAWRILSPKGSAATPPDADKGMLENHPAPDLGLGYAPNPLDERGNGVPATAPMDLGLPTGAFHDCLGCIGGAVVEERGPQRHHPTIEQPHCHPRGGQVSSWLASTPNEKLPSRSSSRDL